MNLLGIVLTPGHFIVAAVVLILYDALMTLVHNDVSEWWFRRQNFPLRLIALGVFILFVFLAGIDRLYAALLVTGLVLTFGGYSLWRYVNRPPRPTAHP